MNDPNKTGAYHERTQSSLPADPIPAVTPRRIGRYRIEKILGKGGFGLVYLAHDEQLQRLVAIKVPHAQLVAKAAHAEAYLTEARTVANLDHPNIVPVHDVGSTDDFPCYVVSKYIDGTDLATRLRRARLTYHEAVELTATVAEALHHAHKQGLVHRDVKPGNILLDKNGKPFVADFGLALRDRDVGKGPRHAGTPAYMSPEQARGEGHRVDGRSDIFSLGVVLYELLVGRQPFRAESQIDLMEMVTSHEPRPLRQVDDSLPKELERICLKAMSKRASERYTTAKDMADDLRHFLAEQAVLPQHTVINPKGSIASASSAVPGMSQGPVSPSLFNPNQPPNWNVGQGRGENEGSTSVAFGTPISPATPNSASQPIKIVPKGLRSFDAHDADFFLELLPGPRDRDGLPDSLRFWKTRIEQVDAEETFAVGLIYGPSGCGKSSLVKAGLLPRLSRDVLVVYLEATADETEARLLHTLRKRCPGLPGTLSLIETLAALRQGRGIPPGKKVVIVLDQFEQWLHAKKEENNTELMQALRQCDGARVQGIIMVRDDFWMAATRFMHDLEIRLLEGQNSAAVDLFDLEHAKKVLTAFGRAFGKLAEGAGQLKKEQKEFLNQAVASVAQDGKVICVRLALFADMLKGKPWTAATLKKMGGTEGVGVTFLEETFSAATAPPEHRYHQNAARAVLRALLPETGADIKGHMRSRAELLRASGYSRRPKDFDDLMRLLDSEIRLITPTDAERPDDQEASNGGTREEVAPIDKAQEVEPARTIEFACSACGKNLKARAELGGKKVKCPKCAKAVPVPQAAIEETPIPSPPPDPVVRKQHETAAPTSDTYYQLTHDFLVPSLREWLTRKQKETRRGRAELLLEDRAAEWNARPENRQLPTIGQWLSIRWWTQKKNWTPPQQKMMRQAARYHAVRRFVDLIVIALVTWGMYEGHGILRAHAYRDRLLSANTAEVPAVIKDMDSYRRWIDPLLRESLADASANKDSRKQLNASLALLLGDPKQVDYLYERLLDAEPSEIFVIRDALGPHKDLLVEKLWSVAERPNKGQEHQRLRAACALTVFDGANPRWMQIRGPVADDLVAQPAVHLATWQGALYTTQGHLIDPLLAILNNTRHKESERAAAAEALSSLIRSNSSTQLILTVMTADDNSFSRLLPKLMLHPDQHLPYLNTLAVRQSSLETKEILNTTGAIAKEDATVKLPDGRLLPAKSFEVKMQAGKLYRINMNGKNLSCYLVIQDKAGKAIGWGGGSSNITMAHTPSKSESFKIHAASLKGTGAFFLSVEEGYIFNDWQEKYHANAALALFKMDQPERVWPLFKFSPDPRKRSYVVDRFGVLAGDIGAVARRLDVETDATIRRALILSLGEFNEESIATDRKILTDKVQEMYLTDADPGIHAAAEWLLRHWNQDAWVTQVNEKWAKDKGLREKKLASIPPPQKQNSKPQWYVNGEGQSMVVVPGPVEFLMGSPPKELGRNAAGELQHKKRISRTFAIAAKPVTVDEYRRFDPKYTFPAQFAPTPDCPVIATSWYQAAAYCNWLSKEEGIPPDQWCYETNPKGQVAKLKEEYLKLTGYRLPTEAEWEYACRAGTLSSRYFGQSEELLGKYSWNSENSSNRSWPVGSKKPNDFGLFDMYGNVWCWCQEPFKAYSQAEIDTVFEDSEEGLGINAKEQRVLRGGSYGNLPSSLRSAARAANVPTNRSNQNGFRVARTIMAPK